MVWTRYRNQLRDVRDSAGNYNATGQEQRRAEIDLRGPGRCVVFISLRFVTVWIERGADAALHDVAGSISQTITYPFDVLRRKMQVTGMSALGYQYSGALDALQSILKTEGVRGLYRGLWPNLRTCASLQRSVWYPDTRFLAVKVAPSIATSFFTYELVKEFMGVA